jgi:hypothetical protein
MGTTQENAVQRRARKTCFTELQREWWQEQIANTGLALALGLQAFQNFYKILAELGVWS